MSFLFLPKVNLLVKELITKDILLKVPNKFNFSWKHLDLLRRY